VTILEATEGSSVFLNGEYLGRVGQDGEFALPRLRQGEHVVMLTHPDLLAQSKRFTVTAEGPKRIAFGEVAAPQVYVSYEGRAGRKADLDWSPGMLWGVLGILALFVVTAFLSHKLFERSKS